jgi:hypothetical protein
MKKDNINTARSGGLLKNSERYSKIAPMPFEETKDSKETNIFGTVSKQSLLETNIGYSYNPGATTLSNPNDELKAGINRY